MPVTNVRLKSCNVHGGHAVIPFEAILHPAPARHGRRAGRRKNEGTVGLRLHARNQLAHRRRERHGVPAQALYRSLNFVPQDIGGPREYLMMRLMT